MSLQETIEELKKEIENVEEVTNDNEDTAEEETTEEQPQVEEPKKEEPKQEEKPVDEVEKPDNAAFARMRREKAALEKKLKELEESKAQPQEFNIDEELRQEYKIKKATEEFAKLEENFKQTVDKDEYDAISNAYKEAVYNSIRIQNPRKSHIELLEETRNALLMKASNYLNNGFDPIQEMYEEAKMLGFKAQKKQEAVEERQEETKEIKPDLDKIAKNKSKNAGMVSAASSGGNAMLTRAAAADLTVGEFAKLSAAEKQRILYNK